MHTFYLTPTAISDLTLLIFSGFITIYLAYQTWRTWEKRPVLSLSKRPFQIFTLFLAFFAVSSYILLDFLNQTLYPDLAYWFLPLQSVAITFNMVWLVQFAYRMPELYRERRRESHIVLGLTLLLPLWEIWYATTRYARLLEGKIIYRPINVDYALVAVFVWMLIVYVRQMGRADERAIPLWRKFLRPQGRAANVARKLTFVSLFPVGLTAVLILNGEAYLSTTVANILLSMGLLFTMLLFALVYLNYLPEQSSFMVRLSAITLAFFLAILGAVGQVMTPSFIASYHNHDLIAAPQTLRFTPNTQGGYDIAPIPYNYEMAQGKVLIYEGVGRDIHVPLLFEFPFYDQHWSDIYVSRRGSITFGTTEIPLTNSLYHYGSAASIYLTGANSVRARFSEPLSGVYAHMTSEQLTLTWLDMSEENTPENQYTLQLRLYADGAFEMTFVEQPDLLHYDVYNRWHTARLIGVLPGAKCDTFQKCVTLHPPQYTHFNTDLPFSSGADGVIEDYHLDFRTALHEFLTPLFWLTLFSALFVPLGLSLVLRQNLVRPLQNLLKGVRQVDSGDLNINIPVQVEDEFGYLTHAFNKMTTELSGLIIDLEDRVVERTAQLTENAVELAETTAYLDNILRSATEYAIATVDRDFRITYINPLAEELYGVSAAEVLGEFISVIPSRKIEPERFREGLHRVETEGAHEYVHVVDTAAGPRHIAARLSGIYDKEGALIGHAHFSRDISKSVQTEAQLQTQQRALATLEERERIGRELHDSVGQEMGYLNLQMQSARALLADEKHKAADELLRQSIHAAQQSHNNLREFILGMKEPAVTPTNFWTALQNYTQLFEEQSQLPVVLSLPADKPLWLTPPRDLHLLRLVQEALTNVRKHAAATQVQIIASRITPDKAQFIISDNGRGFDPLPNPLPEGEGTASSPSGGGLREGNLHFGLGIMRERAAELNGRFEIRSTPGQGTQILVTVEIESEPTEATVAPHPVAPLRVLLVDDHPLFREGLANLLKVYGVTVVGTASNGLEAQKLTRKTHPDLVVMDVEMPVMGGIEATRLIKEEFPDQRIVMLTTSATDDTLFAALKAGASGYLLKSMGTEELFMLIAGLGDGIPPIAPELAGKVMAEFQRLTRPESKLSERQEQILQQVTNGRSYYEIALELHISERTVKRQMKQIMDILHLDSRAEAEEYARRRQKDTP